MRREDLAGKEINWEELMGKRSFKGGLIGKRFKGLCLIAG